MVGAVIGGVLGAVLSVVVVSSRERDQRRIYGSSMHKRERQAQMDTLQHMSTGQRPETSATAMPEYGCAVVMLVGIGALLGAVIGAVL